MTQNHSLYGWAETQLRQWWKERGGIPGDEVVIMRKGGGTNTVAIANGMATMLIAGSMVMSGSDKSPLGKIGTLCHKCGEALTQPFGICYSCKAKNTIGHMVDYVGAACINCGRIEAKCDCENKSMIGFGSADVSSHYTTLKKKVKEVQDAWKT